MKLTRSWKWCLHSILFAISATLASSGATAGAPADQEMNPAVGRTLAAQVQHDEWEGIRNVRAQEDRHNHATTGNPASDSSPDPVPIGGFSPSLFKFVTVMPDDGTGGAGGWQIASALLKFVDGRHSPAPAWPCPVVVEMPLRTSAYGRISPDYAATISAAIATDASSAVMHSRPLWVPEQFCIEFRDKMTNMFGSRHRGLGARVRKLPSF